MLCVLLSVRQIATTIQLSLVFFGLKRSGRAELDDHYFSFNFNVTTLAAWLLLENYLTA